jgi:NHLM bacteriocin system ABC transporter peptidase/ATP-binding protein
MEEVECGAASLGMVLAHFGLHVPLEELRVACGVSRDGANAAAILKAARSYGLEAKGNRDFGTRVQKRPVPAILFWNFNHFVVLEGFRRGKVSIQDPAFGRAILTEEQFTTQYSGISLTFRPGADFRRGGAPPSLARAAWARLRGSRPGLVFAIVAGLGLVVPGIFVPGFTSLFVNRVLVPKSSSWIVPLIGGLAFTTALLVLLTWLQQYALLRLQTKLSIKMSSQFLWHLLRLPSVFFAQRFPGGLVTRVQANDNIATLLSGQFVSALIGVATMIFYVVVMIHFSVLLTLIGVASAFLNLVALRFISQRRVDANRRLINEEYRRDGAGFGGLQMMETLKAQGAESDFFGYWAGYQARTVNAQQSLGVLTQTLNVIPPFLSTFNTVAILGVGSYLVMQSEVSLGALIAFQALMAAFLLPVTNLVNIGAKVQEARGQLSQLEDVLLASEDPALSAAAANSNGSQRLEGFLELRDVTFGYNPNADPIVENFSLELHPGARVALVGATGSGKSTIARLVAGLYQPWSGEILYSGRFENQIPRTEFTNSVAYLDQHVTLFEGSIAENITLWDGTIPEDAVIRAASDACLHEDIAARPRGYASQLEEQGRNLSGGQRQRLEISRALVLDPSLVIMDEATSALDSQTEQAIDTNLRRRGLTCLIVAHRLSTIRDADEIIALDRGKVVERGTHEELTAANGYYRRLIEAD